MFEDNDEFADMRSKHMKAHLEFLQRNSKNISSAGPLVDTKDDKPAGGMWLVTADSARDVSLLVEEDPFWPTGLRKSVRILEWKRVFSTTG